MEDEISKRIQDEIERQIDSIYLEDPIAIIADLGPAPGRTICEYDSVLRNGAKCYEAIKDAFKAGHLSEKRYLVGMANIQRCPSLTAEMIKKIATLEERMDELI